MAASTQDIREYLKIADNLYEACLVIAKRGRLINQAEITRKKEMEILEETDLMEPSLEEEAEEYTPQPQEDIKPIRKAQKEFLERKLEFRYEAPRHGKK